MNLIEVIDPRKNLILMASAGTGKTFCLALRVLTILLQKPFIDMELFDPEGLKTADVSKIESARRIICLTFTRKATAEMDKRIRRFLRGLVLYGSEELEEQYKQEIEDVFVLVSDALGGLDLQETTMRAKAAEERIFKNPDTLRIQTIDSFLSKILKQFPFEAGVHPDYTLLSEHALKKLEKSAFSEGFGSGGNERLITLFERYIAAFNFNRFYFIKRLQEFVTDLCNDITLYRDVINTRRSIKELEYLTDDCETFEEAFRIHIKQMLNLINTASPKQKDEKRYSAFSLFSKFVDGKLPIEEALSHVDKLKPLKVNALYPITDAALYNKHWQDVKELTANYISLKSELFLEFAKQLAGTVYDRLEAQKSRYSFLTYNDVHRKVYELFKRSEYPAENSHLYFRLDGKPTHLLVDEFQDTSHIQWEVLAPIAEEIMAGLGSEDKLGSFFCVGDQKQSLYRFRGAVPGFMNIIALRYKDWLNKEDLDKNRRSDRELVAFANELFREADDFIGGEGELRFNYIPQSAHSTELGFVRYMAGKANKRWEFMLEAVYELLAHNFAPKDIAILVPKWKKGETAKAILEENGIPASILKEEVLSQRAAYRVIKGLVSYMYYGDDFSLYTFLYTPPALGDYSEKFFGRAKASLNAMLAKSAEEAVYKRLLMLKGRFSIMDRLSESSLQEFTALMDIIAEQLPNIINPLEFLEKFEALAEEAALPPEKPQTSYMDGSVCICTINYAKGLEFPAVVLPDMEQKSSAADPTFNSQDISSPFVKDIHLLHSRERLKYTDEGYKSALEREECLIRFDIINKLYVAVTRAEHVLYLFAETGREGYLDTYITKVFPESFQKGRLAELEVAPPAFAEKGREGGALTKRLLYFSKYILSAVKNPIELSTQPILAKFIHERKEESVELYSDSDIYTTRDYGIAFHNAVFNLENFNVASAARAADIAWRNYGGYLEAGEKARLMQDLTILLANSDFQTFIKDRLIYREKALFYDNKLLV
ncbi:MAG: UvrD-helicase domain-containing protein, partial [Deferribacteraceae bacterium]|nr:UvrD-helicase domain-containing protein [Deferribacteraceae bacterium]